MGELELTEIENRIDAYPPQAREDILRLTRELRRFYERDGHSRSAQAASPLYDALTGLLNGGAYGVRFAAARARATRYGNIFAVMSIDLDPAGGTSASAREREQTIKAIAQRLESCVRATDTLARIGDESFAVIVEDLTQPGHAERVKQTVQEALAAPIRVADRDIAPPISVDLEFYPSSQTQAPAH